jgi:hypothetical protein
VKIGFVIFAPSVVKLTSTCHTDSGEKVEDVIHSLPYLGVAQPGSVLAWGARGRGFKSRYPDVIIARVSAQVETLVF